MMRPLFLLCLLFLCHCQGGGVTTTADKPNIVFIFTDDHACQAIGAYGSRINKTPNIDRLAREGVHIDYLRLTAFPFANAVQHFLDNHDQIFVVEQNRDAQLRSLLALETETDFARLKPVTYYGGMPMSCHHVVEGISKHLDGGAA